MPDRTRVPSSLNPERDSIIKTHLAVRQFLERNRTLPIQESDFTGHQAPDILIAARRQTIPATSNRPPICRDARLVAGNS